MIRAGDTVTIDASAEKVEELEEKARRVAEDVFGDEFFAADGVKMARPRWEIWSISARPDTNGMWYAKVTIERTDVR